MATNDRGSVIDKVTKLLELAAEDSGATQGERDAALGRAQALMLRHNIDAADLAGAAGRDALPGIERQDLGAPLPPALHWIGRLHSAIGKTIGVDCYFSSSPAGRRYSIVGRPDNIAYVRLLARWLVPQLDAECAIALRKAKAEHDEWSQRWTSGDTRSFKVSFYDNAISAVGRRLAEATRAADVGEAGTALVRSERAALDAFYGDDAPRTVSRRYNGHNGGASAGRDAGSCADLNPANKVERGSTLALPAGS